MPNEEYFFRKYSKIILAEFLSSVTTASENIII